MELSKLKVIPMYIKRHCLDIYFEQCEVDNEYYVAMDGEKYYLINGEYIIGFQLNELKRLKKMLRNHSNELAEEVEGIIDNIALQHMATCFAFSNKTLQCNALRSEYCLKEKCNFYKPKENFHKITPIPKTLMEVKYDKY